MEFRSLKPAKAYVRIQGGLGNQMFQIALGHVLSQYNNTDVSFYQLRTPFLSRSNTTKRKLAIHKFPKLQDLRIRRIYPILKSPSFESLQKALKITESAVLISDSMLPKIELGHGSYDSIAVYDGYWQAHLSNDQIESAVQNLFVFPLYRSSKLQKLIDEIRSPNSIAIHIRRGDYLKSSKSVAFHGVCSLAYYKKALKIYLEQIPSPNIFFFSDDTNWVRHHFQEFRGVMVSDLGLDDFDTLLLMSFCSNLIISNSSYSWWAARLGNLSIKEEKRVIAPHPWFLGTTKWPRYGEDWTLLNVQSGDHVH